MGRGGFIGAFISGRSLMKHWAMNPVMAGWRIGCRWK